MAAFGNNYHDGTASFYFDDDPWGTSGSYNHYEVRAVNTYASQIFVDGIAFGGKDMDIIEKKIMEYETTRDSLLQIQKLMLSFITEIRKGFAFIFLNPITALSKRQIDYHKRKARLHSIEVNAINI